MKPTQKNTQQLAWQTFSGGKVGDLSSIYNRLIKEVIGICFEVSADISWCFVHLNMLPFTIRL